CPKCGAPKEQFEKIPENISLLIDRSSRTNNLLIESLYKISELSKIANAGIEDNLDPSCLYIFQRIKENCKIIEKMLLSEINVHTQKNKWG
ncbi:MAG: rubredoxin, partial [Clostridia bacterium]|nr:rubredoxin [Clostridia bacterium]